VISEFTGELASRNRWTHETVCVEATKLLTERKDKPYRTSWWTRRKILRRGIGGYSAPQCRQPMTTFSWPLTPNQRIYQHRVSLKQVGVHIAGRSEELKLNYRTTAEILGSSIGLLHG
jgi:hypothetical protein